MKIIIIFFKINLEIWLGVCNFNVKAGPITIKNVVKAEKFSGRQVSGSEPYTDVVLTQANGIKVLWNR